MKFMQLMFTIFFLMQSMPIIYAEEKPSQEDIKNIENSKHHYTNQYEEIKEQLTDNQRKVIETFLDLYPAFIVNNATEQIRIYDDLFLMCSEEYKKEPSKTEQLLRRFNIKYSGYPLRIARLMCGMNIPIEKKIEQTKIQMDRSNDSRIHEIYVAYLIKKEQYQEALLHCRTVAEKFPDIDDFKYLWVKTLLSEDSFLFGNRRIEQNIDLQDVFNKGEGIVDYKFETLSEAISIAKKHVMQNINSMYTYLDIFNDQITFSDWNQMIELFEFFRQLILDKGQPATNNPNLTKIEERIQGFQRRMQHD